MGDKLEKGAVKQLAGAGIHRAFVRIPDPNDFRNNPNDVRNAKILKKTGKKPIGNKIALPQEPTDTMVVNKKKAMAGNSPIPQQIVTFDDFDESDNSNEE